MELVLLHPCSQLLQRQTGIPHLAGMPDQQALTQRSAQCIHNDDLTVGIFLLQIAGGDDRGLVRSRKAGGEGQHQGILTGSQYRLNDGAPTLGIDSGSGGGFPFAQAVINILDALVHGVSQRLTPEINGQRDGRNGKLLQHGSRQVAAGIGNDLVVGHKCHSPVFVAFGSYCIKFSAFCHPARERNGSRTFPAQ